MKKHFYAILCGILAVVLFASLIQKATHLFSFPKLKGVEVPAPMPSLSLKSYADGSFQSGTEAYLKQHFGFREPLLRCYNQYLWDFYGKTYVTRGILIVGKDGWLYEPWAVDDYYQTHFHKHAQNADLMKQQLAKEAKRVNQLQHILEPYGCRLFVTLVPSKDLICPEHLPDKPVTNYQDTTRMSARFFLEDEYTRLGVNHLNLEHYFLQIKDTIDFMSFPKTGTHWSKYAALHAADTLVRYMEHLGGINMQNVVVGPRTLTDVQEPDNDLESLLNLIRPLPNFKYYYASATTDNDSTADRPRLLTVGDSFWWNIANQVPLNNIFSSSPYWYYNSTIYYDKANQSVKDVDLVHELLTSDFVNLFYSTTQLYKMNNGFTKKALMALCYDPEEIDAAFGRIEKGIRADSAWLDKLEERAKNEGKELDAVVHGTAQWLIDTYPENYFPALNDSIPTKRSKLAQSYLDMDSTAFVEMEVQKIIRSIKDSETQMASVKEKAEKNNKTLEQAIRDDAVWIVKRRLERGDLQIPNKDRSHKTKQQ